MKNHKIDIAVGQSARTKAWKNKSMLWTDFVQKLKEGHTTNVTFKEYLALPKQERSAVKDVGGYFGGYLLNGRRTPTNVTHRSLITLDIDFAHISFWEDFTLQYDCEAIIHSTHSHHPDNPRYRLIIPVDREISADEYGAISRRIAGNLDIDLFDTTTFEVHRLMFWPATAKDMEYYCEHQKGNLLCADDVLSSYTNWQDSHAWPTSKTQEIKIGEAAKKQQDPEEKTGIIGAFCRTYTIQDAIEKYLAKEYTEATEGRYTYTKGSTHGGLVIYEDKFAYSHHGTDPISGKLCNAFDLVRIHKYESLDTPTNTSASRRAMEELCRKDEAVKGLIAEEKFSSAIFEFEGEFDQDEERAPEQDNLEWMKGLDVDKNGDYRSTAPNLNLIFAHDYRLCDKFKRNTFDGKTYVFKGVPWRKIIGDSEPMKNVDFSGVRNYIETIYGISGERKIDDCLNLAIEKSAFNPVADYLKSLKWDGQSRIDQLLIDYFGAYDSVYTREAIRKTLVAAVARIFHPGAKFDLVLTLVGAEGVYKSTFFSILGKSWFSDSFMTVHGTRAYEQLEGAWIMEMAELAGLKKAEIEAVKHFITKREDTYRHAYGRVAETWRRQCVFVATTNTVDFLTGTTGNRRFIPIDVIKERISKNVVDELPQEVDQIWAEAVHLYRKGEKLYMSPEADEIAKQSQIEHSETDERAGGIEAFLNTRLPDSWDKKDTYQRRDYLALDHDIREVGTTIRKYVCVAEIWCEYLGRDKSDMDRYKTRDINAIVRNLDGWELAKSPRNFKIYGRQKYYKRKGH